VGGFLGINFKKSNKLSASTMVGLLEPGRRMGENRESSEAKIKILSELCQMSPQSVRDLADATDLSIDEVKYWVGVLSPGYVTLGGGG
jgi:hypothetical protein